MQQLRSIAAAFLPNRVLSKRGTIAVIVAWAVCALIVWVRSPFKVLPQPGEVLTAFGDLWMVHGLSHELATSFFLNMEALAIATAITLTLAYATVLPGVRPVVAAIAKCRFLGLVGLSFMFTLMVGTGRPLKLSLLVFGITVFFVTAMAEVVARVPKEQYDLARTLRMNEWQVVWEVVVLGTLDQAIEMLRQNAAIGWMMLTMVEGISRSEGGVGAMLLAQDKHFHLAAVFAVQITILLLGLVQDYGIGALKRVVCPYADLEVERR